MKNSSYKWRVKIEAEKKDAAIKVAEINLQSEVIKADATVTVAQLTYKGIVFKTIGMVVVALICCVFSACFAVLSPLPMIITLIKYLFGYK